MAITRLPGSKWWVETDDVTSEIIGTYNKALINAEIASLEDKIKAFPDPSQEEKDIAAIYGLIEKTNWIDNRKKRTSELLMRTQEAYKLDPRSIEVVRLMESLTALVELKSKLV